MAYEQRNNSASLFKNDRKTAEEQPNAKGEAKIDGVEYWVSAWTKKDKNGNPWQSLAFTPKEKQSAPVAPVDANKKLRDLDDDIPF